MKLHNLKRCSRNLIIELHNWIMEPHNLGSLSPSALHIIQQNINLTLFRKNISPRLLFLDFVFNLYLLSIYRREPLNEAHDKYIWYPRKLLLLTISRLWRYADLRNFRFNFLLYENAPWVLFEVGNVLLCSPFMFENIETIPLIDGQRYTHTVCASALMSILKQWLDSYEKNRLMNVSHVEAFYSYEIL